MLRDGSADMRFRVAKHGTFPFHAGTFDEIRRGLGLSVQDLLGFCLFEVAFYFAYTSGMSFSQIAASPFWFPDSILLCALLVSRPQVWWIFILLPLPIRMFSEVADGIPVWFLLTTFWIDSAKGLFAAIALRHFIGRTFRLETVREFIAFFLFAVLLIPAISAFCGATARSALGHDYWVSWEQWFLGDALAQMIVTPAILHWGLGLSKGGALDTKRRIEAALLAVGLIATGYLVTNEGASSIDFAGARFYLPVPFMFWAAFRFGMRGASGAVSIIAILAVHGALQGRGPFSNLSPSDITLALQNFLLLRSVPLYVVAAAIAQRKEIEARLRESEQRFRNLANETPAMLWVSGPDTHTEFVSQRWLDFTGRTLEAVIGDGWLQDIHPDDLPHVREVVRVSHAARQPYEVEYRVRRHDGEYRWIADRCVLRHAANGDVLGYAGMAIDITERKQAEENARLLSHAQRLVVMGELSATIAHEVRQPLSAILSNADAAAVLLRSPTPPLAEIKEIIADIRADDLRANEIVSHTREFLRAQPVPSQPIDVNATVKDALHFIAGDARRRRVQIRPDFQDGLPAVFADRTQVQQVLMNLLVNAMDAMDGTPDSLRRLTVKTEAHGAAEVEVSIADRGNGIPAEELRHLFEPFFTTRKDGMGLGLSIARSIVAAHHGRIWADNNPDGGATFHFTLPVARDQPKS